MPNAKAREHYTEQLKLALFDELAAAIKSLLECCELNLDDMEPETHVAIEAAQKLLAKLPK